MNRIELFLLADIGWMAHFSGPHADTVQDTFNTTILPTAFTHNAKPGVVIDSIRKMNPGVTVEFEPSTI